MIELVTTLDALVDVFGGAVMVAFGAWVLTLTPRTRETKLLAIFAIAAGGVMIPGNLFNWTGWHLFAVLQPSLGAYLAVAGLALLGLTHSLLEPDETRDHRLWHVALVVTALLPLVFLASSPFVDPPTDLEPWQLYSTLFELSGFLLFYGAFLALSLVLAWRYRHPLTGQEDLTRTQAVLMSAALVLWPAFFAGASAAVFADPTPGFLPFQLSAAGLFAGFLFLTGLWLANRRAAPDRSAEGRNLALLIVVVLLLGMIDTVFFAPLFPDDGVLWGVIRLATVLVLGYAILRHEILGIDAKFRWGVSKTTVASVFVAVFFVVSEGAQALFAGVVGSQLLGIIAAGALLFALAPIQRAADRIAEAAVPSTDADLSAEAEERYRKAIELALADGRISVEERRHLAERAEELGLSHTQAAEIREQVEDELEGDG